MKTVLVSLVSEMTIPNILVAAHYKPEMFWFISTPKMEKELCKTQCIRNTLKLKGLLSFDDNPEPVIVDQDSLTDCINKIGDLVERTAGELEYVVNITGGNKIMALATYEIFREIGQKVIIGYVPLGKNQFIQIFPRKKPPKVYEISARVNLEEYLSSYGFRIQNKDRFSATKEKAVDRGENSKWILGNYEPLREVLSFLYRHLSDIRGRKRYRFAEAFGREFIEIEKEMLERQNFEVKGKLASKELTKEEIAYLTGAWFEEYVFHVVYDLEREGIFDDSIMGVRIRSLSGAENEIDVAFTKHNSFYYIECKTLGDEGEQRLVSDEVYKKGAISTLLGKGEKRAMICTTLPTISESLANRAKDYGVEILSIQQARNLKAILRERFE